PTHGECEVKLIGNHLRVIHSDMELFNIKYFNLKGELVDQNVIPTIRIVRLLGQSNVFFESLSPDEKYLIVQGRKVWSVKIDEWKADLLAEDVWIDHVVQWLDNGYVLVIWHKPTFTKLGEISPKPKKYWGFLKVY
ncbi:MAG: hypothetical protein NZ531_03475, partial [Aquificaceae bacterium]|nr:hypothetical protein [Aquificaceae bacterium]